MAGAGGQKPVVGRVTHLMVDIDGVVVIGRPADGAHWKTGLEVDLGISAADLKQHFFQPFWAQIVTGQLPLRPTLAGALAKCAPHLDATRLIGYWFSHDARLDRAVLGHLAAARARGLKAYFATNQDHERARYLWQELGLARHGDGMIHSARLGVAKPDPGFFEGAARITGAGPAQHLLIDDSAANVSAAHAAGWQALHWTAQALWPI